MGAAFAASALALVLLVGCVPEPSGPATPTPEPTVSTEPAAPPQLQPDASATDNLAFFTQTAQVVWESEQRGEGRAYIDALVAAGFDRGAMQVTPDLSTVGNPAESIQFSVRWGDTECLVGQVGPSTGQLVTKVLPQLAEGRCLIGATRPIDW